MSNLSEKPRPTNVEFVTQLMEFSRYGALAQIFVIDALAKRAEAVSQADARVVEHPLVSGEAWVGCAREIKAKLDAQYGNSYEVPEPGVRTAYL